MSLKSRLAKVEEALEPKEPIRIHCVLRPPDDPEPKYPPGTIVIRALPRQPERDTNA